MRRSLPRRDLSPEWQKGVPARLERQTGHAFPVLSRIRNRSVIRAVASMLRESRNAETTGVGLDLEVLAGVVFATVVADDALAEDVRALASRHGVREDALDAARAFAADDSAAPPGGSADARALLDLARAASPSPARITPAIVGALRDAAVEPAASSSS